ncbi:MAG TPA: phosphotransferase [Anaerolineales bacterium]|nr:phosphotransferase [Anaerolineales bacterium]
MASITDQPNCYVEAIHTNCPGIEIHSARLETHDGEFNDILIVNDDLVFRFPRYADAIPAFLREIQLLPKLKDYLPLPIPAPLYFSGIVSEPGKVFMGYPLIHGRPLYREVMNGIADKEVLQELARQLAGFLSALHGLTPAMLDLEISTPNMPDWVRTFYAEVQEHLFPFMRSEACHALSEHFKNYFNHPVLQTYHPALIHGDFGGSNILIDGNRISGILDFSSMEYNDPALDIASVSTYGEPFFSYFCQFYALSEPLRERACFYRGIFALEEALFGWKKGDKKAFESGMEQYV